MKHNTKIIIDLIVSAAIIIVMLAVMSCCPKIVPTETVTRDTIVRYYPDTILIKDVRDSFSVDMSAFCDSVFKMVSTHDKTSVIKEIRAKNNASARLQIVVDSTGRGELVAIIDSLKYAQDSLRKEIKVSEYKHTIDVVYKCTSKFHRFLVWWFIASIAFIVLLFALKRR